MHDCPSRNDLESLLNGSPSDIDWDGLNSHLEHCGSCETILDELTEMSDVGVQLLSSLPPTKEDEPAFRELHAQLISSPTLFLGDETMDGVTNDHFYDEPFAKVDLPIDIGRYRLLEPIGAGATGTVYKARHLELDRPVAIKILSQRRSMDHDSVERFRQEIRAIGQLQHPHIVHATDAGEIDGRHYLVMEYADGTNLSELLQNHGPLTVANACEVIRQAALGLAYAHDQKMVHRDVKLSNLLLTNDGTVKLLDLGLVAVQSTSTISQVNAQGNKTTRQTDALSDALSDAPPADDKDQNGVTNDDTKEGQDDGPRGTADYMSPEQWTHYHSVDHRSDLYSLGCTLFKLLTGTAPFHRMPTGCRSKREAHLSHTAPELTSLRSDIPSHLQDTLNRLLAKQPDQRIQTAAEVASRVARHASSADLQALVGHSAQSSVRPRLYQRRKFLYAASAAILLGGFANWQSSRSRSKQVATDIWRPMAPVNPRFLYHGPPEHMKATDRTNSRDSDKAVQSKNAPETKLPDFITTYDVTDNDVTIESERIVLLNFGRPTRGEFSLSTSIKQAAWQSQTGLFFGYQLSAEETSFFTILTVFDANESPAAPPKNVRIIWQRHRFGRKEGKPFSFDEVLAEAEVTLQNTAAVTLEVTLGQTGTPLVLVQGQKLGEADFELSFEGRQQHGLSPELRKSIYLGRLGVVCGKTRTIVANTRLKYHA